MGINKATLPSLTGTAIVDEAKGSAIAPTWLDRQLQLLQKAGLHRRAVAWHIHRPPPDLPDGVFLLRDRVADSGPLAGLETALSQAGTAFVLVLAVDMQLVSMAFIQALLNRRRPGLGIVPRLKGRLEPLLAVYPCIARNEASRRLELGQLSVQSWVQAAQEAGWVEVWTVPENLAGEFANWNFPADLPERIRVGLESGK